MVCAVEVRGLDEVMRSFKDAGRIAAVVADRGLPRVGKLVRDEAKINAPRSPTKEEFSATLKRKKVTDRNDFFPGGLEQSIEYAVHFSQVFIFVRDNSPAGKYAKRIHDEKGRTWRNRGPGTIAKGEQADEKFIERAIRDKGGDIDLIFQDELHKAVTEVLKK